MREITKDSNLFAETDKRVEKELRSIVKKFNALNSRFGALKFDELNSFASIVLSVVQATYRDVDEDARDMFMFLYWYMYCYVTEKDRNSVYWPAVREKVDKLLTTPNDVTGYKYTDELDRKRARLVETLIADISTTGYLTHSARIRNDIKKAEKNLARQVKQYADNVTLRAVYDAYEDLGVDKVQWITQHDKKVCADCRRLDGRIFAINKAPGPVHYNCRCFLIPVHFAQK